MAGLAGPSVASEAVPTYGTDVKPILERSCVACHRPGDIAPMSLQSYDDVRPWARAIRKATTERTMPPWFADAPHGVFANDSRLTDEEIATLRAWVEAGAPRGDPAPVSVPESPEGWRLGTPDLVVSMPEPYPIPAAGEIDYVFVRLPTGLKEDRWLRGIEVLPGDRSVIHHVDVMLCGAECQEESSLEPGRPGFLPRSKITEPPEPSPLAMLDGEGGDFLFSFLPGGQPMDLPDGMARLLPANAEIFLSLHYTARGEATEDLSRVGLYFAEEPPERRVLSLILDNQTIWIPAGAEEYRAESRITLGEEIEVLAYTPHMHFRGKASQIVAVLPDGEERVLLDIPRYDFNWQITYVLADRLRLPRGTRLSVFSTFDNSTSNPYNPDPSSPVPWGRQSWDEMASAFVELSVPRDLELDDLIDWSEADGD